MYLLKNKNRRQLQLSSPQGYKVFQAQLNFRKVSKFSEARKLCCKLPKIQTKRSTHRIFCLKDPNGIANSEDPDQTALLGAV